MTLNKVVLTLSKASTKFNLSYDELITIAAYGLGLSSVTVSPVTLVPLTEKGFLKGAGLSKEGKVILDFLLDPTSGSIAKPKPKPLSVNDQWFILQLRKALGMVNIHETYFNVAENFSIGKYDKLTIEYFVLFIAMMPDNKPEKNVGWDRLYGAAYGTTGTKRRAFSKTMSNKFVSYLSTMKPSTILGALYIFHAESKGKDKNGKPVFFLKAYGSMWNEFPDLAMRAEAMIANKTIFKLSRDTTQANFKMK